MQAINPATGEKRRIFPDHNELEIEEKISKAQKAFLNWRTTPFNHRTALLKNASVTLKENMKELAITMAVEMGKPVREGQSEVEKCSWVCEYYAEHAESFLAIEEVNTEATRSYVAYQPLGIVLAIMPWNFPFWQVFRFAAPALMAGNATLLKHAPNVPECANAIEEIFLKAGFPEGLFTNLFIDLQQTAEVIEHPKVKAVTLTGSTTAGKAVAAKAGAELKKTVLELGGSDPYIILEDANLTEAAKICATSRLINNGQSCISAKRFIVVETVRETFEKLLVEEMSKFRMGDPLDISTHLGTIARKDLRDNLSRQVEESISRGARCLMGGYLPAGPGYYYPPTVLTDVERGMPAYEEEMFGPVASIIAASSEHEAITIANDTAYGLGAAIFSEDVKRAEKIAQGDIEAGACFINSFVKSDPRLPFGGIKASGYGRELSYQGIKEFVNIKTIYRQ